MGTLGSLGKGKALSGRVISSRRRAVNVPRGTTAMGGWANMRVGGRWRLPRARLPGGGLRLVGWFSGARSNAAAGIRCVVCTPPLFKWGAWFVGYRPGHFQVDSGNVMFHVEQR